MAPDDLPSAGDTGLDCFALAAEDEPALQAFFEANPDYFVAVQGQPAGPGEAHEEIHGELPAGWPFTKRCLLGYRDTNGNLAAFANVVSDLLADSVWHIGLYIVATERHGKGQAQTLLAGIEHWARSHGAQWLRLGVVAGNARAERFWERCGFLETRQRTGVPMGEYSRTIRVMVKPLGALPMADYFAQVPRDLPDSE